MMGWKDIRRATFSLGLGLLGWLIVLQAEVHSQQWASKLFTDKHHDFGTVGRNAKAEFGFTFTNPFEEDLRISSVRSSCGCTKPTISKSIWRPGEKGEILAQFNTTSFIGHKQAMITVVIDRPYYAEVQLTVSGNIRSDIVTEPGEVRFGDVDVGQKREIPVKISHAGRTDWKITDVRGNCEHLEVRMDPPARQGGTVIYTLRVRLRDDTPVGEITDELTIVTNDGRSDHFVMPVSARVLAPVTITPKLVALGPIKNGTTAKQKLVVRGNKPFSITAIDCSDARFQFTIPPGEKPIHVVPFEFQGNTQGGAFQQTVLIRTSLGETLTADCIITGEVN